MPLPEVTMARPGVFPVLYVSGATLAHTVALALWVFDWSLLRMRHPLEERDHSH